MNYYTLQHGDVIREGDEFERNGHWRKVASYDFGNIFSFIQFQPMRRPIGNDAKDAFYYLKPGDIVQAWDEWESAEGWRTIFPHHNSFVGVRYEGKNHAPMRRKNKRHPAEVF